MGEITNVFHISFLVDDKKLTDVLKGLNKHIFNLVVVPVENVKVVKGGKVKEKSALSKRDQLWLALPKTTFTSAQANEAWAKIGGTGKVHNALYHWKLQKRIKPGKEAGQWVVL
jgi:hypothetical protein